MSEPIIENGEVLEENPYSTAKFEYDDDQREAFSGVDNYYNDQGGAFGGFDDDYDDEYFAPTSNDRGIISAKSD